MVSKTFRIFSLVCYDVSDNLNINELLFRINRHQLNYFYIKHEPENDELKPHYHLAIYFKQPTTITYLSHLLDISENNINVLDELGQRYTLKKTVGYFLHYNNNEKINYNYDDFITNIPATLSKYYDILTNGRSENGEISEILAFIDENNVKYLREVLDFCISNNYLKTFKKYSYVIKTILFEK